VAAEGGWARRVHARGLSAKQRLHFAALLIALACAPLLRAQSDIGFDPAITQAEFVKFSRIAAQSIYATPVDPARARGLLGFDIGVAVVAVPVDTASPYWQHAVQDDFTVHDYVAVPRIVASKGLSVATLSATYAKIQSSDITMWGGALDVPIFSGGLLKPTIAIRGAYSTLSGSDVYDLKTYGAEVFLSKGFGPVTPYIAAGRMKLDATGTVSPTLSLHDDSAFNRYTVGVKLSLLLPKIVIEATQGEERSYAAKISFGL
jgi:hypothetical protein